jgi:hypothetical protein
MPILKVLKSVETDIDSSDIWRFAFHSNYPTLKIATVGSQSFTIPAGNFMGETTIAHNLGYTPLYNANALFGTLSYPVSSATLPFPYIEVANESGWDSIISLYSFIDDTNLVIGAATSDGENVVSTQTFTAYWIIFLDEF